MTDRKLSVLEKLGYGLGDGASNLIWMSFIYFQSYFYTDVFGLAAGSLAVMLSITRIWDMGTDIIVGVIADRTKTRWGKFRPYLIWMAVPFSVVSVLTWTTPPLAAHGKLIYAYVTLTLMMLVYSGINIPYGALMGVISPDPQERTSASSWRFSLAFVGGMVVAAFTQPLVAFFGKGNQVLGYEATMAVYALGALVMFLLCFASTKERVQPVKEQNTAIWRDLGDLVHNYHWLLLCLLGIAQVCFVSIRGAAIMYYFTYYMGDLVIAPFGHELHLGGAVVGVGLFILVNTVLSLFGTFLIQYVTPFTGRKNAFIGCMLIGAGALFASYFVRPDQLLMLYGYHVIYSITTGPTSALLWAMFADTADYSEWKTGRRATGLVFSASGMSNKFGWAIGGTLAASLLAIYGYQAHMVQTAHAQEGIRILMAVAPGIGTLVCAIGMMFYSLEGKMSKISAELAARRAAKGAEA
ncbi:MAG TPA: MFS transporter [Rhizomicrobium sp.]|nr:MFS transporter [Rhizomicrobium sp.]